MYSTRIIQHHCKNFIVNFVLLIVNFSRILPRFDFSTKFALATYELTHSLVKPAFYHVFHTQGRIQIGSNQSRSPLWNIILFSCLVYLPFHKITMSLVRVYWRYDSFSLLFAVKLRGIIFFRRLTVDELFWFSFRLRNGCKRSLFCNCYLVSSHHGSLSNVE